MSPIACVVVVSRGRCIPPFGDAVGAVQILGRSLAETQAEAIAAAGLVQVESPPVDAPYLLLSDRTWVTGATLRALVSQAEAPARLQVTDATWLATASGLQELPAPGVFEVGLVPAGGPPEFDALPPVPIDLHVEIRPAPEEHPALAHAMPQAIPFTDAGIHQVDHWLHILRTNWMAMSCIIAREVRGFSRMPWWSKAWKFLKLLLKVRSLRPDRLARGLSHFGEGCRIHPTAVIEASVLGDNVEVGPFSVVRGSLLGDGVRIEEHATINASVLGAGARVGRRGTANLCVLYDGAFVGAGNGFQASIFGEGCFLAWSVTVFDISFGKPIRVWHRGEKVSSETFFLGAAIGHRARIGGKVQIGYGAEVPNEALVVADSDVVLRNWQEGEGPHRVVDGCAEPLGPKPPERTGGAE